MKVHSKPVRIAAWLAVVTLTALAIGNCGDDRNEITGPEPPDNSAVVVSEPVLVDLSAQPALLALVASRGAASFSSSGNAQEEVSFVSYAPGSIPEADSIEVRNRTRDLLVGAPMVDGGVDPIAIPALVGDTLEITVFRQMVIFERTTRLVPDSEPPVVVRTDPPRGRTRVPLNALFTIVFSEPMDGATVTPASVRLLRNGELELGTVTLSTDGLRARFVPQQRLRGETQYVLQVTTDVTDVSGDPLEATLDVEFTTDVGPVPVGAVTVWPSSAMLVPGARVQLRATVRDTAGSQLADPMVTWTSSDTAVAIVSAGLTKARPGVAAAEPVTVTITATSSGVRGTAAITVERVAFASVQTGKFHTCALTANGRTYCWGNDYRGHLGLGFAPPDPSCSLVYNGTMVCVDSPHAVLATLSHEFTSLTLGMSFTCGLATDGAAYCWGENRAGNLGNDRTPLGRIEQTPIPVSGGRSYVSISARLDHACALTADGEAYCWGSNTRGQLGDGTTTDRSGPVPVIGGHRFSTLSAGRYHTCGVATDGTGLCWGSDLLGQLGHDEIGGVHTTPVPVAGGLNFTTVSAGWHHTCGLVADDTAYCWGGNVYGQLGDGTNTSSTTPVPVAGGLTFESVGTSGTHTCALTFSGDAYCWGQGGRGQLGDGTSIDSWTPVAVAGGLVFRSLSVGFGLVSNEGNGLGYACGLASDSGVYCWGWGGAGNLGLGVSLGRSRPALVIGSR